MKQKIFNVFVILSILILFVGFSFMYYQLINLPEENNAKPLLTESFVKDLKEKKTV
jgi:hypothetical protein